MSTFLDIAVELRHLIYDHLAADPYANNTALLSTCRQINQEAHVTLMRAITLKISYDIRDHSKSATSLQERWASLSPRTRQHVGGIHFNINHIDDLSVVSASQLMLQFCGPKNFIDRVKVLPIQILSPIDGKSVSPAEGNLKITFSVEDFDPEMMDRLHFLHEDNLVEFFYALQQKAMEMEMEKNGPKEYKEVEEELLRMLDVGYSRRSATHERFFFPVLWVRHNRLEHDKRLLAWREAERMLYFEDND
ncbi:unnamed protein product [Zymoseptoria tritici ST99CH_1E4]|uniref:Uncharacterized protein n=1 Tax=Zymoseptoria tritici ST99CH_1E4 TaxID=1276532 RepID=A0A2H1GL42_ZYMTR|nr:unnamed protein product [Zymoseptoria tritici ST99CH_1E4]